MEVKPGYKLTEVGVIPEDWKTIQLNSVADVRDGTHDSPKYVKNGVPFVTSKNIISGEINIQDVSFISKADAQEVNKRSKVDRLDILVSMIGTVGNAALVNFEPDFCIKNVALIKPHNWAVESRYLTQLLRSDSHTRYIEGKLDGGIQKFISLGVLRQIEIPLPPLPEQTAIATTLSDVDALISSLDALISKKKQIKQGAMQELLSGKRRLPGFSGEWEVKRLGDVAEIISGGTPKTVQPEYWNGDIIWCTPTDITGGGGKYLEYSERTISTLGLINSSATLLPVGAILLCTRATIGEMKIATKQVCTNQGFKSLIASSRIFNEWLYYVLATMKPQLIEKAIGSTFLEISKKDTALLELLVPPLPEQQAIAAILSDMDAEITTLEARRNKTKLLKQGMMQELLTGRIRLVPSTLHAVSA
ncbi:MAG: restriction endonuclease subunit S [Acidithiobacillus ferrivorans]